MRTPNNRALLEPKIDELWDKWHRQLKITSQGVVHGHGTVAKVRLFEGHTIVDPTAIYMEGPPPDADQDGGARSERFLYINQRNHLKIGSYAGEPRGAWALSYFVNEARDGKEATVAWRALRGREATCGQAVLWGWELVRDVAPGDEVLTTYEEDASGMPETRPDERSGTADALASIGGVPRNLQGCGYLVATAPRRAGLIKFLGNAWRAADRGTFIAGRRRARSARCACCSATRVCRPVIMERSSAIYVLDGMPQRLSSQNGVRFLESRPAAHPMPEARATRRPDERRRCVRGLQEPD
mgnify:CR=1 FL=1